MTKESPMPFTQSTEQQDREPITRLGGLFPSKSGKALCGGIDFVWQNQDGETHGDQLLELLQQAKNEQKQLRILIFQNNRPGGAPYTLNVALGELRVAQSSQSEKLPEQEKPRTWQSRADNQEAQTTEPRQQPPWANIPDPPEPPRPTRRVAPRRT